MTDAPDRTMVIVRVIAAPVAVVWGAWMNNDALPQWWGPEGFSCRTTRIDLRAGGEWVFDMIGPDGAVFPNHRKHDAVEVQRRIGYTLHGGENGPNHAEGDATFDDLGATTRVTLTMVFVTAQDCSDAKAFGAEVPGLQTLGKLAAFVGAG